MEEGNTGEGREEGRREEERRTKGKERKKARATRETTLARKSIYTYVRKWKIANLWSF